jgi:peptidyl-prolyl cis-trans isomerase B (cyclophilin B)
MDIVRKIEDVEKGPSDRPKEDVTIANCGEIPINKNEEPYRADL